MAVDEPDDVQTFCRLLRQLHAEAGAPPVVWLARQESIPLGRAAIYNLLNGDVKLPPKWLVVKSFVEACNDYAKRTERQIQMPVTLTWWQRRHDAMRQSATLAAESSADVWPAQADAHPVAKTTAFGYRIIVSPTRTRIYRTDTATIVTNKHNGPSLKLRRLAQELEGSRRRAWVRRPGGHESAEHSSFGGINQSTVGHLIRETGREIGTCFLASSASKAIGNAVKYAERNGTTVTISLVVDPQYENIPFELLTLDGLDRPLALYSSVRQLRCPSDVAESNVLRTGGPLRILVAVACPSGQRTDSIDYESELNEILDSVDYARRARRTVVHVLQWGTIREIRRELSRHQYHVLHLVCALREQALVLERVDGGEDPVTAAQLVSDAFPHDRVRPMIVLGGRVGRNYSKALVSNAMRLGRSLIDGGIPAVLTTLEPTVGHSSGEFIAMLYRNLTEAEVPSPVAAFADARRRYAVALDATEQDPFPGWPDFLYFSRYESLQFDLTAQNPQDDAVVETHGGNGSEIFRQDWDKFVGRRAELRSLLHILHSQRPSLVLRGIGGVGKTTLARVAVRMLYEEGVVAVDLSGEISPDQILERIAKKLRWFTSSASALPSINAVAEQLENHHIAWRERLDGLAEHVLPTTSIVLLLDNFEENQDRKPQNFARHVRSALLDEFLIAWLRLPSEAKLVIATRSRLQFSDPDTRFWVTDIHLSALSVGDARKLASRLPGLNSLSKVRFREVVAAVGGHPRALEYVDALLRRGSANLPEIESKIYASLRLRKGSIKEFLSDTAADPVRATKEAIALAADDVLLGELLQRLDQRPLARELLLGASVYRLPVDLSGLQMQVSQAASNHLLGPEIAEALADERVDQVRSRLGREDGIQESPAAVPKFRREIADTPVPQFRLALKALIDLGLLAPGSGNGQDSFAEYSVHRWTALAIARASQSGDVVAAHVKAAAHWEWRLASEDHMRHPDFGSRMESVTVRLEQAHHLMSAQLYDEAASAVDVAGSQLDALGSFEWAEQICAEYIEKLPPQSAAKAMVLARSGILAARHANYGDSYARLAEALEMRMDIGDLRYVGANRANLATLKMLFGNFAGAVTEFDAAVRDLSTSDDNSAVAAICNNLGNLFRRLGVLDGADDLYRHAIDILAHPQNRKMQANQIRSLITKYRINTGSLEMAFGGSLADLRQFALPVAEPPAETVMRMRGDYPAEEQQCLNRHYSHAIVVDGINLAAAQNNLAIMHQLRAEFAQAREHYGVALEIANLHRDRGRRPIVVHNLATLAQCEGDLTRAEALYFESMGDFAEVNDLAGFSTGHHNQGTHAQACGDLVVADSHYRTSHQYYIKMQDPIGQAGIQANLGTLYELDGDNDAAEAAYQSAWAELSARSEQLTASIVASNLGRLLTRTGRAEAGLRWTLRSLAFRWRYSLPQAAIDLYWARRQHGILSSQVWQTAFTDWPQEWYGAVMEKVLE